MSKKKSFICIIFLLFLSFTFFSCNKDDSVSTNTGNPPTGTGITGNWQVDQIQMISAPTTGTLSAIMKTALVPFGLMSASNVGVSNVSFGTANKWESRNIGTSYALTKVQYTTSQIAYAIPDLYNSVYKTNDGGNSWSVLGNINLSNLYDMQFINENTGWLLGYYNSNYNILMTTNGGNNWITKYSGTYNEYFRKLSFVNSLKGWALSENNSSGLNICKTTNGGSNWTYQNIMNSNLFWYLNLKFIGENVGCIIINYISGTSQVKILKTTNGGDNWSENNINNLSYIRSAYILDVNNIWISGYDNSNNLVNLRSNDGGGTWTSLNWRYTIESFYFFNSQNGYAVGGDGLILYTTNGGSNWTRHSTNSNNYLYSVSFGDAQTGCAVGSDGTVLKFTSNIDTAFWTVNGYVTNPAIQLITKSGNDPDYASGYYYLNGNTIVFTVTSYSNGMGNTSVGSGTYSLTDKLTINLDLANSEKWKIILKR
jgi:photosystem II stability/assembly factor-like uncharacterized protein